MNCISLFSFIVAKAAVSVLLMVRAPRLPPTIRIVFLSGCRLKERSAAPFSGYPSSDSGRRGFPVIIILSAERTFPFHHKRHNSLCFLCQQLVGDSGIRVLFLNQSRHSHHSGSFECRSAGVSSYAYRYLRAEVFDDAARFPLASCQFDQYGYVFP